MRILQLRAGEPSRLLAALVASVILGACDTGTEPGEGVVRVSVVTEGVDLDLDGYRLTLDDRFAGLLLINQEHVLAAVTAGTRSLALEDVATNCSIIGDAIRTVQVSPTNTAEVEFNVVCERAEQIVFNQYGPGTFGLALGLADGTDAVPLVAWGFNASWSPDGSRLAFSNAACGDFYYYYEECTGGVMLMDAATRDITRPETGRFGFDPAWAPDGEHIAFSHVADVGAWAQLRVLRLDGSPAVTIHPTEVRGAESPTWSPDAQRIAFTCHMTEGPPEICVINRDGTGFTQLTNDDHWDQRPAWSPDGSTIAFVTNRFSASSGIALMAPDGSGLTFLTPGWDPAWSPDGTQLVFAGAQGLFRINVDGSDLRQLTTGSHSAPAWRP